MIQNKISELLILIILIIWDVLFSNHPHVIVHLFVIISFFYFCILTICHHHHHHHHHPHPLFNTDINCAETRQISCWKWQVFAFFVMISFSADNICSYSHYLFSLLDESGSGSLTFGVSHHYQDHFPVDHVDHNVEGLCDGALPPPAGQRRRTATLDFSTLRHKRRRSPHQV